MIEGTGASTVRAASAVWRFGNFRLDVDNALLTDGTHPLDLAPKAFDVLCHLVVHAGQLVTKEQLLDAVWGGRFVGESVLKTTINVIRNALGDDARAPRFIETVARRGYRFVGMAAAAAAPTPERPASRSVVEGAPLIGRDRMIDALLASMDAANDGARQMVLLGGPAGIGKSTLIRAVAARARARGETVAIGQCVEQSGGGEPYLPVLDALAELARGPDAAAWLANLRQAAPTWLAQLPWLVVGPDREALRRQLADAAQDRMLREFGALLDLATVTRPLLLVIEDLHWSDHGTVSLLDYLARRRGPARWMVMASFRPADAAADEHPMQAMRQELCMHALCRELLLSPFDEREVDQYLAQRLGGRAMPHRAALARALHHHTAGLPLFLARVLDGLDEDDALAGDDDRQWADAPAALARLELPRTVVSSIERRIARLTGDVRDLLEAAGVLGLEFDHPLLAAVLGRDADDVRADCVDLARRGDWLREAGIVAWSASEIGGRYAFAHPLYRRVFHERSAAARRLQLHLRAAEVLEGRVEGQGERAAAELAQHFERACETASVCGVELASAARDASAWRLRAARAASAVHAPADALAHYALAKLDRLDPRERMRARLDTAALHLQLGAGQSALDANAAALDEARRRVDPSFVAEALLQRAQLLQRYDRHVDAIGCVDEMLALDLAPDAAQRAHALVVKAEALDSMGRQEEADAVADAAMACLPADADAARARYLAGRVAAHHHRGEFASGLQIIDDALTLYERIGDAAGAAIMVNRRGTFLMHLGRPDEAEATLLDAYARSQALNHVQGQRGALLNLVKVRTDRGDAAGAQELLDAGWRLSPDFESPLTECAFLSGFYYCSYFRGDLGAAWRDAARVRASAEQLGSVAWRAGSLVLVCGLHIYLGDLAGAKTLVDRALAQTHASELHHIGVQAKTHAAWIDVLTGRATDALATLDAIDASGESVQPEDRAGIARVRAQAQLAVGRPEPALQVLAGDYGVPTQEVWALMLALRLRAQIETDGIVAADLQRARDELADSRVPALESTVLRAALAAALEHDGRAGEAVVERERLAQHRRRLLDSLAGEPDLQAAFMRTWT